MAGVAQAEGLQQPGCQESAGVPKAGARQDVRLKRDPALKAALKAAQKAEASHVGCVLEVLCALAHFAPYALPLAVCGTGCVRVPLALLVAPPTQPP
eukprot:CAMPEP_0202370106 /NCGR_PEP_ID=MMETSP1127-20130417/1806_1 /ASSEMBLY_ACC=CAM_ASM_000462 /TAXON_ID=3047 /ORGANISM="Dunaliella tertiolecta, Strain CCMP1320" /LENGTH=96 /DNA_ID=CAMNT_0048965971 /DNA_START=521 /DNA_END=811 /DNA_ORIENTATION=+